ncbi:MAG: efflux RND transporter periplasmic adaptor subunit [Candidatus Kapabacteria bacterium]|nr:efflux RND transporter periplasmic adaptor subunit [Candidatus Kapabacteria bacterium]
MDRGQHGLSSGARCAACRDRRSDGSGRTSFRLRIPERTMIMKHTTETLRPLNQRGLVILMMSIITISIIASGCGAESSKAIDEAPSASSDTIRLRPEQLKNVHLAFASASLEPIATNILSYGSVHVPPQYAYSIPAPFGGIVRSVRVLEGTHVHAGQPMVTLEHPDFITMQQDYLVASAQLDLAEQELKRQTLLARDSISARKSLERAQSEVQMLRIQRKGLAEKLALLNIKAAALTEANLSRVVTLSAPIDGYVTSINANIGTYIQPNTPVLEVVDTDHMHIELAVFERDVYGLRINDRVMVNVTNSTDSARSAHVHLIGKEVRSDRTVPVHVHLDKHDASLTPGTSVKATISAQPRPATTVAETAIVRSGSATFLYTGSPTLLVRRQVRTGTTANGRTEILDPQPWLNTEQILVQGANQVRMTDD